MNASESSRSRGGRPARQAQLGAVTGRTALILIALLFLAPAVTAWLVHKAAEHGWWTGSTTNKGTLIQPPRTLTLPAELRDPKGGAFPQAFLQGKWTLLYVGNGACGAVCRRSLYTLRQVRLAQGENIRRVQRLFLATDTSAADLRQALAAYPDLAVALVPEAQAERLASLLRVDKTAMQGADRVYLVDPLGNLMMYYPPGADPRGMIKDLERLLKYSHVG